VTSAGAVPTWSLLHSVSANSSNTHICDYSHTLSRHTNTLLSPQLQPLHLSKYSTPPCLTYYPPHHHTHPSPLGQAASLLGLGLLYQGSCHRLMVETVLEEISRTPGATPHAAAAGGGADGGAGGVLPGGASLSALMSVTYDREGYALAAGGGVGGGACVGVGGGGIVGGGLGGHCGCQGGAVPVGQGVL